jgi:hypothetical protein
VSVASAERLKSGHFTSAHAGEISTMSFGATTVCVVNAGTSGPPAPLKEIASPPL